MASPRPDQLEGATPSATEVPAEVAQPEAEEQPGNEDRPGADSPAKESRLSGSSPKSKEDKVEENDELEEGEAEEDDKNAQGQIAKDAATTSEAPPLPNEPVPLPEDDGWEAMYNEQVGAWYFYNRFTGKSQWDNPRVPDTSSAPATTMTPAPPTSAPAAGGYNPAIHGDYDPNAWYAQLDKAGDDNGVGDAYLAAAAAGVGGDSQLLYVSGGLFNRESGQFQDAALGPERHGDEAKSQRQMHAYFDVDAAANAHDGRSLKAERSGKKPSKSELKAFKEKRRAKKEEKRRAWLRD